MAVFRSDQSQLTYAMESAPGGDVELNNGSRKSSGTYGQLTADHAVGTDQLTYDGLNNGPWVVGDMVRIGNLNQ